MILRDPVHGLVAFEGIAEQVIGRLLATREVQRLRNVRQLGFTSFVFPGAEHSRFAHSVGAAHVMVRMLNRMRSVQAVLPRELALDQEAEADALAAALLHDLGHGPFSHLFEEVLPHARAHEQWTMEIIRDPATDVHRALASLSAGMPERVATLIEGEHRLGYLARSVSGELDADRCDYLLRDSHMTGVRYGIYDLDWLLQALSFGEVHDPSTGKRDWVLAIEGRKGLPPIEGFFLARQFMYQQVYHHKATRSAEALIRAIFIRACELVREGNAPKPMPRALENAALDRPVTLSEYLALDDITLLSSFREWEQCNDAVLATLCGQLTRRDLPKTIPLDEHAPPEQWERALYAAREVATRAGLRADLAVQLDVAFDSPYEEPDDASPEGLWVVIRHRPIERLGRCSFLLGQLRNQRIARPRLVLAHEIRGAVLSAIEPFIGAPSGSA
jgi:HD superfamily phosphohydrolase